MNKRSREDWKNEINRFKKSGLSINKYCRENSLSSSTFRYWNKKYDSGPSLEPVQLVKVSNPMKIGERMKLSCNQVTVDFPVELAAGKIAILISALQEISQ